MLGEVTGQNYFHPIKTEDTLNLELLSFQYNVLQIPFYCLSMLLLFAVTYSHYF